MSPFCSSADLRNLGVVNETTVSFTDQISGVLGFGFPRLSRIYNTTARGNDLTPTSPCVLSLRWFLTGAPFFSSLAWRGIVGYPIFGIYLTRNSSGTLSLGKSIETAFAITQAFPSNLPSKGAIDSSVVGNISNIEWHYVVPFAPEGASNNVSSYLYWTLPLSSISVWHDQHVFGIRR